MSNVDDRIVRLDFEGSGFESGASKALETLDKLDNALNLDGAAAGLESVKKSLSGFNLNGLSDSVESVAVHFSKLDSFVHGFVSKAGAEAFDFVSKIPGKVINAATTSARDGFGEYEQQMKSVQTIAANSGEKLEVIQANLDSLNEYADKTSYVFSDMTSAIGRFTSAGLGVEESTKAIQGFFNAAALSGAGTQEASRGVYQLSQAMSAGVVKLQDWKSIENASIDTEKFRRIIMLTAEHLGVTTDEFKKAAKGEISFRESLAGGWLTADVMQEALENLTMSTLDFADAEEGTKQLMEQLTNEGYSEAQAKQIIAIASAADQSAREIRTFSQMMDTMKESLGSGWAKTWQLIIGNYEQSAEFFTWISGRFSSILEASSNARNAMLEQWQEKGGRKALIGVIANLFEAIERIITPIADAFSDVFAISGEQLAVFTENIANFTEKLVISGESMTSIFDTFQSAFMIIHSIAGIIGNGIRIVFAFASSIAYGFENAKDSVFGINSFLEPIAHFLNGLHAASDKVADQLSNLAYLFTHIKDLTKDEFRNLYAETGFNTIINKLIDFGYSIRDIFEASIDILVGFGKTVLSLGKMFWAAIRPIREFVSIVVKFVGGSVLNAIFSFAKTLQSVTASIAHFWFDVFNVVDAASKPMLRIFRDIYISVTGFATAFWEVFGSPLISTIRSWFDSIHDFIKGLLPDFNEFGDGIGGNIVSKLTTFSEAFHKLAVNFRYKQFKETFQSIADTVGGPLSWAFGGIQWIFNKVSEIVSGPLHSAFKWLGDWISGINFSNPLGWLFDSFGKLKEWFASKEFSNPFAGLSGLFDSAKGAIGGLKLSNPFSGIFEYLKTVKITNPFKNFKLPKKLLDKLAEIKEKFKDLGSSSDDARWSLKRFMKQAGQKIKTSGKNRLDSFIEGFKKSWNSLKEYFKDLSTNGNSFVQNVKKIFEDIYKGISDWVHKIAETTDGFGGTIAKGFDFVLQGLGKVPEAISGLFGQTKQSVEKGAKSVSDGANKFKEDQKTFWGNLFGSLPSIGDITSGIGEFFGRLRDQVMEGARSIFTGTGDFDTSMLQSSLHGLFDFSGIKITLPDFSSPIQNFLSGFSETLDMIPMDKLDEKFTKLEDWLTRAGKIAFAFSGWKFLGSLTKYNKGLATQADGTGTLFKELPGAIGEGLKGLGKAFGGDAAKEIKTGMTDFSNALKEFGKSFSPFSKKQATSKSFLQIAEAILVLAGALFVMSKIPADDLERAGEALLKLAGVAGSLIFFAAWLSAMTKLDLKGVGFAMAGLGIAMVGMAAAIFIFTQISKDPNIVVGMNNFKLALEILTVAMSVILLASYGASDMLGVAATILAMTAAIGLAIGSIVILGLIPQGVLKQGEINAGLIGVALTTFVSVLTAVSGHFGGNALLAAASLIPLVAAITLAIIPITILAIMPDEFFKTGAKRAGMLGGFLVACAVALSRFLRFGKRILGATLAMIPLIAAITLAIIPVGLLALIPLESLKQGGIAAGLLGGFLIALVAALSYIGASLGVLAAAAVGATLMMIPMIMLTGVVAVLSWVAGQNLEAMETAVWSVIGMVAALAGMAATGMLAGGGMFIFALGTVAIAGALVLLGKAVEAIDFEKFHTGMVSFGQSIGEAGANVITGFLGGIAAGLGQLIQSGIEMAQTFLSGLTGPNGLISHSPSEATEEIGEFSIEGFLNGVANKLGEMLGMGENSGEEFLSGLSDLPNKMATKAVEAVNTFVDNIDTDKMVEKGTNIIQGLIDGTKGAVWESLCAIPGDIFHAIVDGLKSLFGIESPSTYMKDEIGFNIIQGLINGITGDNLGPLGTAASLIFPTITNALGNWFGGGAEKAGEFGTGVVKTIESYAGLAGTASGTVSTSAVDGMSTMPKSIKTTAVSGMTELLTAFTSKVAASKNAAIAIVDSVKKGMQGLESSMKKVSSEGSSAFVSGISSAAGRASAASSSLTQAAKSGLGSLYWSFHSVGSNGGSGLVDGLLSKVRAAVQAAADLAGRMLQAAKDKLKVNSPSKEFRALGESAGEGLVQGIHRSEAPVTKSSSNLAGEMIGSFSDGLTSVNIEDILDTDYNPVISPVIDPTEFNYSLASLNSSLNSGLSSSLNIGNVNYSGEIVGKLNEFGDYNKQALQAFAENAIDYNQLGNAVAGALIASGVHVEIDGGKLMGYLAGEIQDARRMYK